MTRVTTHRRWVLAVLFIALPAGVGWWALDSAEAPNPVPPLGGGVARVKLNQPPPAQQPEARAIDAGPREPANELEAPPAPMVVAVTARAAPMPTEEPREDLADGAGTGALPGGCTIHGTVRLIRNGEPIDARRVVAYVARSSPRLPGPTESRRHTLRISGNRFSPSVLVIAVGDTVEFVNEGAETHSVFSASDEQPFEMRPSRKGTLGWQSFMLTGPVLVQCDVHEHERADVLVLNNDHYAFVRDGGFALTVPPGKLSIVLWEPNGATVQVPVVCATGETVVTPVQRLREGTPPGRVYKKDGRENWGPY